MTLAAQNVNTCVFSPPLNNTRCNNHLPKIVSLFCGAGGLDLGFFDEGFEIPLAIDISSAAIKTHKRNFKDTQSFVADLIKLKPEGVHKLALEHIKPGERIGLIGGPPCQGFSRANHASQTNDPRNKLPQLYLDIVKKLQATFEVEFVVFENVLGIRDKKHIQTYLKFLNRLKRLGFNITEKELCATDFGVPQSRRRIIVSALRKGKEYAQTVVPKKKLGKQTVSEAISHLPEPSFFQKNLNPDAIPFHPNHWTMQPKSAKFTNPDLYDPESRSFKRLSWDKPSPTVAFGNREIHVHPSGTRRISVYEAMLLQGFPEQGFILEGNLSEQVQQVSNAVPPPLARSVAAAVKECITK